MSTQDRKEGQALSESLPSLMMEAAHGSLPLGKLAVTGGIASGKSTVVACLAELGLASISADQEAKRLREDPQFMAKLAILLGSKDPATPELLREFLKDQDKRRIINTFFHGQVWKSIRQSSATVVEVPLLVESCLWPFFQHVWSVSCPIEIRKARMAERGMDSALIDHILSIQVQDAAREAVSDCIFDASKSLDDLKSQVLAAFQLLPHGITVENRL